MISSNIFIKNNAFGGMLIPAGTNNGTVFNIVSMNMFVNYSEKCYVELHFACSIVTTMAKIHISLQIFKQGKYQLLPFPISSVFSFFRESENGESNTFSFSTIDCDLIKNEFYNYSVYVKVIGGVTVGTTAITNSSLMAIVVENI